MFTDILINVIISLIFFIIGIVFQYINVFGIIRKRLINSRRSKRQSFIEGLDTNAWLVDYYTKNGAENELYTAKILDAECKVSFLTKPEWVKQIDINDKNIVVYDSNVINPSSFSHSNKVLNRRRALGSTLINNPTTYFRGIEEGEVPKITASGCSYFQMATTLIGLEDEVFDAIKQKKPKTPLRDRIFSRLDTIITQRERPLSLGCTTALIIKHKGGWKVMLHTRSFSTVTNSGKISSIPSFGIAIPKNYPDVELDDILWYNFQKEYCEEVCGFDSLIDEYSVNFVDNPLWFLKEFNEGAYIDKCRKEGKYKLYYLGFGVDAINGSGNVVLSAVVSDEEASNHIREMARKTEEGSNCQFISLDSPKLMQYLSAGRLTSPTAFAVSESAKLVYSMENSSSNMDKLTDKLKDMKSKRSKKDVSA